MCSQKNVNLTASEIASIWQSYMSLTHCSCILKYSISIAEDMEVRNTLTKTLENMEHQTQKTKHLLEVEKIPVPVGFGIQDIDMNAPRLFSDSFSLLYFKNVARMMTSSYSLMYTMSSRKDIMDHFRVGTGEIMHVFELISNVLLDKGIYNRAPIIDSSKKVDFIENKDYVSGNNLFGDQRFLNAVEISHVFGNLEANVVGNTITKAFGQTADKKEVREFMEQAGNLSEKIISSLTKVLTSSQLPAPMPSETQIYSSTQPPFSDKFVMYQMSILTSAGVSDYATSVATSLRNDLKRFYSDVLQDTVKLGKKAETLMIKNSWLEQPPQQEKVEF
ncbi:DUF3231 family protein [Aquibacillus koreensis]|uniref:DUF3231 family protein n=2 Tax=Aquibacillus koreensis TaxID=279446 RepID=A0A9X3WM98_9BACI|nr:DUF3231 family protein [Aquibacillus koreensis]MCT2535450.1 DUF3231 family protein [Aquibacillus koreensis]MDC3422285.1 DUF3231 family protein [Aquibacillus koreensis]